MAQALLERGLPVAGANLLLDSDVPTGAGLSASAALELAVGYALASLAGGASLDRVQLAAGRLEAAERQLRGPFLGAASWINTLSRSVNGAKPC